MEVALLVSRVEALRVQSNLSGIQLMTTFVQRRVQPLCSRPRGMWAFEGPTESTRVVPNELSTSEIEKRVRILTKFSSDDSPAYFPTAAAFSKDVSLPEVKLYRLLFPSSASLLLLTLESFLFRRAIPSTTAIPHFLRPVASRAVTRSSLPTRQCMWLRLRSMMPLLTTGKSGGGLPSRIQRTRPMPPLPGTRSLPRQSTRLLPALLLRLPPRSPRNATFLMSSRKFLHSNTFCLRSPSDSFLHL